MYEFVVQDGKDDGFFGLDFAVFNPDSDKKWLTGVWQKLCLAVQNAEEAKGAVVPEWCGWKPWEWAGRQGAYANRKTHIARCGDDIVGFINYWENYPSQHEAANVLYVEHLGAFPGSLPTNLWRRKYRQVGTALLAYAIKLSKDLGTDCRIGLHSENAESTSFYRRAAALHPDRPLFFDDKYEIVGPTPHGVHSHRALLYLETRPDGGLALLEDYDNA